MNSNTNNKEMKYTSSTYLKPYGYKLSNDVYFIIDARILFNMSKTNLCRLQLRTTMASLLEYLLNNSDKEFISDDDIMADVWEANDLRASSHRLWQVMRELKIKLNEIGVLNDIFYRADRSGYIVNRKYLYPLYREETLFSKQDIRIGKREHGLFEENA